MLIVLACISQMWVKDSIVNKKNINWNIVTIFGNNQTFTTDSLVFCPAVSGIISDLIFYYYTGQGQIVRRRLTFLFLFCTFLIQICGKNFFESCYAHTRWVFYYFSLTVSCQAVEKKEVFGRWTFTYDNV